MAPLTPQEKQWLTAISFAEGTYLPGKGPQYNIQFGGGRFANLAKHPNLVVKKGGYSSAAAGAYQFMPGTWASVSKQVGAPDFGPASQDRAALELIRRRGVDPAKDPITPQTLSKLAPEWASLPTVSGKSFYGQPVKSFQQIQEFVSREARGVSQPGSPAAAPSASATRIQLPRFNLQGALKNILLRSAVESAGQSNPAAESIGLQQKADELADAGYQDEAEVLESKAISKMVQNTQSQGLDPVNLVQNILNLRKEQQSYDAEVSQIERSLNDVAASQVAQATGVNVQTAAKPGQTFMRTAGGGIAYPNAVVTSAVDATGEPGLDFALPGGENAMFVTPFNAEVLKVVRESNATNRGPGGRGYGNYVELRGVTPEGKPFDTLVAHFNQVNPNLKPGMKISAGTPVGTQGTTGRATGPHISMDFFEPGSTQASADILRIRDIVADRIKKGKAPFG